MKLSQVTELPTTLDTPQVAELFGVSAWSVYQGVKAGTFPVAPIHVGRRLVFPTIAVLRAIGMDVVLDQVPQDRHPASGPPVSVDPVTG